MPIPPPNRPCPTPAQSAPRLNAERQNGRAAEQQSGSRSPAVLPLCGSAVLSLALLTLAACSAPPPALPDSDDLPRTSGDYNPPRIISSTPERDQRANASADDQLSEADWRILQRLGPRPIWERLEGKRKRSDHLTAGTPGTSGSESAGGIANAPVSLGSAGTRAPGAPGGASGAEGASIAIARPLDETQLPITNLDAPDGKSRFMWVLRSLGGSTVATSRDASTSRRTVALALPDLTALVAVLTQQMGEQGAVTAMPRENTLVITCDTAIRPHVLQLLDGLDIPARQVEITAKIFEVSQDFDFQHGAELVLNHLAGDGSQSLISTFSAKRFADAFGKLEPTQGSALRLMEVFQDAGISVDFTFQLLAESGLIQVVSSPRMTVAVGQTGYMLAGQELPIQSANLINNLVQTTTNYKPVGVQLYITPQSADQNRIKLHTISIVSAVSGFAPLASMHGGLTKGFFNPIIDSREAETAVTIGDGDTLVISGLRMVRNTTRENKIPGLGDLPGLEWMFKNHRTQQQITDLYFFVTPTLLPLSQATQIAAE